MKKGFLMFLVVAFIFSFASNAYAFVINLFATDSKTIAANTDDNWNDNLLRTYFSNSNQGPVDGFMKFDFSSIPDAAVFTSMTLTTYHNPTANNPKNDPQVIIYRTAGDSWARGQKDTHPGLNEVLTPIHSGFPTGNLVPYAWDLNVSAVNWQDDLNDDILSLVMRNEKTSYSYVYWYGSDTQYYPPKLTIEYNLGQGGNYVIPEPATMVFLGIGLLGIGGLRRSKVV